VAVPAALVLVALVLELAQMETSNSSNKKSRPKWRKKIDF
jgi:hypothetical protein